MRLRFPPKSLRMRERNTRIAKHRGHRPNSMLGKNNMKICIAALAALAFLAPLARSEDAYDLKASIDRGKMIYMQTCIACHQPTGLGLPGAFPPLAGTEYTQGDARR